MDREELLELIKDIQSFKSEFDHVEIKAGQKGAPKVTDTLSSFSNKVGGGIIIFGIDENQDYDIVGIYDVADLQKQIMNQTKEMEPEVRAELIVEEIDGKHVIAALIPECPTDLKPCFIKTKGMRKGSYIRVGDSDELMNDYEIYNLIVSRGQAQEDKKLVPQASLDDLDHEGIKKLIENVRILKPKLYRLIKDVPYEEKLRKLNIADKQDEKWIPTLAGLLVFGLYPQQYFPSLVVTFLVLPHKEMGIPGPRGERFLDNKKIEGNINDLIDETEALIIRNMKQRTIIQGLSRLDIWEYPEDAIREAVRNAVIHRDYSDLMQSNYIQIRMFPDRLEIESPGTLYGDVTINNLISSSKARNSVLITLLEDLKVVENRGSGIDTMIYTMKTARLEPPQFKETRNSFIVTFKNHNFLDDESIKWLNDISNISMSDRQAAALVYIKNNGRITNREYQELNSVDSVTATKELKYLLQNDLIMQNGTRGGAFYTLINQMNDENSTNRDERSYNKEQNSYNKEKRSYNKDENSYNKDKNFAEENLFENEKLLNISKSAREKGRLSPNEMEKIILELCSVKPLMLKDLTQLLNRSESLMRSKLSKLV
ncbi:MAG TPA: ATP-binding protein, partial [Bacillales bacterium]|nr:ATP-binding protein [Bacillales bacterium]